LRHSQGSISKVSINDRKPSSAMKLSAALTLLMGPTCLFFLLLATSSASAEEGTDRDGKIFPLVQIIKIPNDVCAGDKMNGTCYTAAECTTLGGKAEKTCGKDFGVCCIFSLSCGGSTSYNNSYMVMPTTVTSCTYTICPMSTGITRIRFNFESLILAQPALTTNVADAISMGISIATKDSAGQCLTDFLQITAPTFDPSPVICGTNTGEHMVLDSDGTNCMTVTLSINTGTTFTRSWTIVATQYLMGQEDSAGPRGCLQYFTGTTGFFSSFNFPSGFPASTTTTATDTHLASQKYDVCIRREFGYCENCYLTVGTGTLSETNQMSFGLGVSTMDTTVTSTAPTSCTGDFLTIPSGYKIAAAIESFNKFCGRFLNTNAASTAHVTICTKQLPFKVGVNFDATEVISNSIVGMTKINEPQGSPSGSLGFGLVFKQTKCT